MAYRAPQTFGRKLPPGLGEINLGATPEEPIDAEEFDIEDDFDAPSFGSASVPNPKPVGAAKIGQFKQLGSAGGQKMSNFFQHPFTHLTLGFVAGLIVADIASDRFVMPVLKHPAATLAVTSAGTLGVLSVVHR
jgi:hypothetical protein